MNKRSENQTFEDVVQNFKVEDVFVVAMLAMFAIFGAVTLLT